ncbi:MAG: hypothetical protein EOO44_11610 [Flavobacterium sp.]|nr:MAG: hypothetical protein EOO44_11610 [Flavobacterium sp.]
MRKTFLIILLLVVAFGCNQKSENIYNDFSFNEMKAESIDIIIKLHDTLDSGRRSSDIESFAAKKEFNVSTDHQFDSFDKIFIDAEITGYCCCPTAIYSIQFINDKKEIGFFYVDTIQFKDKIRMYEGSFQYSYIIDKQKWNNFLNEIKTSEP